jgi:hypothetical protein
MLMRKSILLLCLLIALFWASPAKANEAWRGFCEDGNKSVITSGISSTTKVQQSFPQCTVTWYIHGGGLATIYADNNGGPSANGTPLANPFQANLDGSWIAYAPNGRYDIQTTSTQGQIFTYLDILLCDPAVPGSICGNSNVSGHNLLSTTHLDTIPFSPPVRGDVITAQSVISPSGVTPSWARLALGSNGQVLTSNGTDVVWANTGITGTTILIDNTSIQSTANFSDVGQCSNFTTSTVSATTTVVYHPCHGLSFSIYNPAGLSSGTAVANYTLLTVPFACTLKSYSLGIDTGTITVKFWKIATGTAIPTVSNVINTSGVSISSGTAIQSTTMSDFTTTAVAAYDIMAMDITAVSSASLINGVLLCQE